MEDVLDFVRKNAKPWRFPNTHHLSFIGDFEENQDEKG
jgi:hypothetical protein